MCLCVVCCALCLRDLTAPGIAAELEEACFFINLLPADGAWQPWVLEFFFRSDDDAKRTAFLRGAELLQLYCELKQDEAFKHDRCVLFFKGRVVYAVWQVLARQQGSGVAFAGAAYSGSTRPGSAQPASAAQVA